MFGSKGKIDIAIQKYNYAPGDIISGNVALTLKKPVQARGMSISLIGTGKQPPDRDFDGTVHYHMREHVYEFKQQLDGEKEYSEGREYRFAIEIPSDILSKQLRSKRTREFTLTRKGFKEIAIQFQQIRWYLLAKLDIPHGPDTSKKVEVTIG